MTTSTMNFNQVEFYRAADKAEIVEFNPEWLGDTGYLDKVKLSLQPGKRASFTDSLGRRAIVVGTRFGDAVVFERYTPDTGSAFVMVTCVPQAIRFIIPSGVLSYERFAQAFVHDKMNIGFDIETLFKEAA